MKKRALLASLVALTASASTVALAQTTPKETQGTVITLSTSASRELKNDEAYLSFYVKSFHETLAKANKETIEKVNAGLTELKKQDFAVTYQTESMNAWPRYNNPKKGEAAKVVGWDAEQSVSAHVKKIEDVAEIMQIVAKHFAISGVNFSLSKAARQHVENALTEEAVNQIMARAKVIAKTLGKDPANIHVESLNFGEAGGYHRPVGAVLMKAARMNTDAEAMTMPSLEAGNTSTQVSVTAKIRLN